MRSLNGTIKHMSDSPSSDERPEYLMSEPYLLAVDTETTNNRWFDDGRPFLATASDYDRDYLFRMNSDEDIAELQRAILMADGLIFHNASYDIHMLVAQGLFPLETLLEKTIHDTEIVARLTVPMSETPNYKLKTLAEIFLGEGAKDTQDAIREAMVSLGLIQRPEQKEIPDGAFYEVWLAYPDLLETYALADTRSTYDLFHVLRQRFNDSTRRTYRLEQNTLPVLVRMEHHGIALDPPRVEELHAEYVERDAAQQAALKDRTFPEFNMNAETHVRQIVEDAGVELTELTPSGQIAVNKWALQRASKEHPEITDLLEDIFEARSTSKFINTYIEPMRGRREVHPSFIQIGARTGRMACMSPNMQNIPVRSGPEMRSMFIPRDGRRLVVADYSSIELRLLDYYMNGGPLHDIIEEGDPFLWLGEQVFGTSDQDQWPVKRSALKNGFYAMTYGAGGPRFAETVGGGMTKEEGRAIIKRIKGVLGPKYKNLDRGIQYKIRTRGFVTTLAGREQHVSPDKAYVGLNALIQGSAADILKHALVAADPVVRENGGNLILTVHDEIVADVPKGDFDFENALVEAMVSAEALAPNGRLSLKVGVNTVDTHYADAK